MQVPHQVYLDLAFKLRNMGDTRDPDEAVVSTLKAWLAGTQQTLRGGYQWKELFLPDTLWRQRRLDARFSLARCGAARAA